MYTHFNGWGRARRGGDRSSGGSWLIEVKLGIKILTHFLDKKILALTARTTTSVSTSCFVCFELLQSIISNKELSQPQI